MNVVDEIVEHRRKAPPCADVSKAGRRRGSRGQDITVSDYFCGAGGSSTGAIAIPGVRVAMAVNHWDLAIETHNTNHPDTDHDRADMSNVDPRRYPRTTIGWFSPECTYWSQARGEKLPDGQLEFDIFGDGERLPDEAAQRSRMTMWDVPRFTEALGYEAVIVENVPRVVTGAHWQWWLKAMHGLGYNHEVLWLNSMHAAGYGPAAPQSRDRIYIVFWRKENRRPDFDKWLRPTAICADHGGVRTLQVFKPGGSAMKMYRTQYTLRCPHCAVEVFPHLAGANTIIDWDLRGTRIGDRPKHGLKELAEKTMLRAIAGARRYWLPLIIEAQGNQYDATDPKHGQHGSPTGYYRAWPTTDPLRTLHTSQTKALIVNNVSGADASRSRPVDEPLPGLVAGGNHAALMVPVEGRDGKQVRPADRPMRTQSTRRETGMLVPPLIMDRRGEYRIRDVEAPLSTITANETTKAILVPYYSTGRAREASEPLGTVTTVDREALVVPLRNHGKAKPTELPIDTVAANGNHHALVVRQQNSRGQMQGMATPVDEPVRTLTAAGNQSLHVPSDLDRYEVSDDVLRELVMDSEFRMLEPHEIKRGMAFDASYVLLGNKREQVKLAGNAVTPNAARDIIAAVAESLGIELEVAA